MGKGFWDMIFGREPVAWVNLVKGILVLLVAFGVNVTESQQNAIIGLVGLVGIFLVGGLIERQLVTPVKAPQLESGTVVTVTESGQADTKVTV